MGADRYSSSQRSPSADRDASIPCCSQSSHAEVNSHGSRRVTKSPWLGILPKKPPLAMRPSCPSARAAELREFRQAHRVAHAARTQLEVDALAALLVADA